MLTNRIDSEVSTLKKQLESRKTPKHDDDSHEADMKQSAASKIEVSIAVPNCLLIRFVPSSCRHRVS